MRPRRFILCDVFADRPTKGNGLAVVADAAGLSDEQMQGFANWINLAETTFLTQPHAPGADYAVRIFTPKREMPFAGHPTLGSCASWLHCGGHPHDPRIVRQECAIGVVEIDLTGIVPAFVAPPTKVAELPAEERDGIAARLGIAPESIVASARLDNGPVWRALELASAEDVLAAEGTSLRWPDDTPVGLIGPHAPGGDADWEVRMLAPSSGMEEDPVTGSLNAALAHWMRGRGRLPDQTTVAQGTRIGREGRIRIRTEGDRILIGGRSQILVDGTITL